MCNLYSQTKGQAAIRELARAMVDRTGNLPSLPGVYPDTTAPIVRVVEGERALTMARWGMPSPAYALQGRLADGGVTNIRNTGSPHWRRWLVPAARCLVPFTSFAEYGRGADGKAEPVWFALGADRPIGFFAGLWTRWTGVRRKAEGEVTAELFGFLTTEANAEVGAVHPKAMPVILTEPREWEVWLRAGWGEAIGLQRALGDGRLCVVGRGEKEDGGAGLSL